MSATAVESGPLPLSVRLDRSMEAHKVLQSAKAYRSAQHERVGDEAVALIGVLIEHGKESKQFGEALAALYGDVMILKHREELVAAAVVENTRLAEACAPTRRVKPESIRTICAGCAKHLSGDPSAPVVSHGKCSDRCWNEAAEKRGRRNVAAELTSEAQDMGLTY